MAAGATDELWQILCESGDPSNLADQADTLVPSLPPRALAALATRPDAPAPLAAAATEELLSRPGGEASTAVVTLARSEALPPAVQRVLAEKLTGETLVAFARRLDAPSAVEALAQRLDAPGPNTASVCRSIALLLRRPGTDDALAAARVTERLLRLRTRTRPSSATRRSPEDGELEVELDWALSLAAERKPDVACEYALEAADAGDEQLLLLALRNPLPAAWQARVAKAAHPAIVGAFSAPGPVPGTLLSASRATWPHLDAAQRREVLTAAQSGSKNRAQCGWWWMLWTGVAGEAFDDPDTWRTLPLSQLSKLAAVAVDDLPEAAVAAVSRPDVDVDLAFALACAADLSPDQRLGARPGREYRFRMLARFPSLVQLVDDPDELLALVRAPRTPSAQQDFVAAFCAYGRVETMGPTRWLQLPWRDLRTWAEKSAAVRWHLSDALAPVLADPDARDVVFAVVTGPGAEVVPLASVLAAAGTF